MIYGFVYAIKAGGAMKVGYSDSPEKRLVQLQSAHHETLILIDQFPGFRMHEDDAQGRLKELGLHIRGEWFRYDERVHETFRLLRSAARERLIARATEEQFRRVTQNATRELIKATPVDEPWDRDAVAAAFLAYADGFIETMEEFTRSVHQHLDALTSGQEQA